MGLQPATRLHACICWACICCASPPALSILLCACTVSAHLHLYFDLHGWLQLKGAAAGMMAIAYQVAHFVGLATATLVCWLMFGSIGLE